MEIQISIDINAYMARISKEIHGYPTISMDTMDDNPFRQVLAQCHIQGPGDLFALFVFMGGEGWCRGTYSDTGYVWVN